ncbi:MAG TPA: dihydropteroate synthase [Ktedonobacterales bacterium]|nr:dihydropteroate synthase [Ktedonobacterales bacterium]
MSSDSSNSSDSSAVLAPTIWGRHTLAWGAKTWVMGILNITPDSFSQDGLAADGVASDAVVVTAVARAQQMVADGAEMLDIGGESTRPSTTGEPPLDATIERGRVVPVIAALTAVLPPSVILSIDTYKASVAEAALDAGASLVNDITGLHGDARMAGVVAARRVPVVMMSNLRGKPRHDPVSDVLRQLSISIEVALAAGIPWEYLILDPGFGFGLAGAENLRVLSRLRELRALGRPLLIGTSRKAHIGLVLGTPVDDRLEGTAATVALGIAQGADIVRVHDVRQMARVVRMSDAVVRGWQESHQ